MVKENIAILYGQYPYSLRRGKDKLIAYMKSILKQVVPAANGENVWMVINVVYRQKRELIQ